MRKPSDFDPYEILGLDPSADDVVIRAAWKALIQKYHPDTSVAPDAAERAAKINAAFKLLAPVEARAAYDRRRAAVPPQRKPAQYAAPPVRQTPGSGAPPHRRMPVRVRKWPSRIRKLAVAGLALAFVGAPALYAANQAGVPLPGPLRQAMDGLRMPDLSSMEELRTGVRRLVGLDTASEPAPLLPPKAETLPPPIDRTVIIAAIDRFERLSTRGVGATVAAARGCVTESGDAPGWAVLDACAALDFAGLIAAEGMLEAPGQEASYFELATQDLRDRYALLSSDDQTVIARLDKIRTIVWPVMLDRFEARVRERQRAGEALPN